MSSKTVEEALAFVAHVLHGRGQIHFESVLGFGNVPDVADFAGAAEPSLERCEGFLSEVGECASSLWAIVTQARIKLQEAQAAERAEYLPGLAPEGLASPESDPEEQVRPEEHVRPLDPPQRQPSPQSVIRTAMPEAPKKRGPGRPSKAELAERERVAAREEAPRQPPQRARSPLPDHYATPETTTTSSRVEVAPSAPLVTHDFPVRAAAADLGRSARSELRGPPPADVDEWNEGEPVVEAEVVAPPVGERGRRRA